MEELTDKEKTLVRNLVMKIHDLSVDDPTNPKYSGNITIVVNPTKIVILVNHRIVSTGLDESWVPEFFQTVLDHYKSLPTDKRYSKSLTKFYMFCDVKKDSVMICSPAATVRKRSHCLIYPMFEINHVGELEDETI